MSAMTSLIQGNRTTVPITLQHAIGELGNYFHQMFWAAEPRGAEWNGMLVVTTDSGPLIANHIAAPASDAIGSMLSNSCGAVPYEGATIMPDGRVILTFSGGLFRLLCRAVDTPTHTLITMPSETHTRTVSDSLSGAPTSSLSTSSSQTPRTTSPSSLNSVSVTAAFSRTLSTTPNHTRTLQATPTLSDAQSHTTTVSDSLPVTPTLSLSTSPSQTHSTWPSLSRSRIITATISESVTGTLTPPTFSEHVSASDTTSASKRVSSTFTRV